MSGFNCESKIKSSSEYLKAKTTEIKMYTKMGTLKMRKFQWDKER